ncbi:MAG: hypothetical protein KDA88_16275 [Planctomycetaceae bacterium]|nr:hypothetical protein [Planctomycetaceae bacterium]MCB9951341.1 hypothetical protein [Planctomycetaceae bacterium]
MVRMTGNAFLRGIQLFSYVLVFGTFAVSPTDAAAGWPFFSDNGPPRGSREWYEMHAADPPGVRQKYAYGKMWPPVARPTGPKQPAIHTYYDAHFWPNPYNLEDRRVVRSVMQTQVDNGWLSATTLYHYHFDADTNELNSSGQQHLHWLLTHAPIQYRQANVASDIDAKVNSDRVGSVEREIDRLLGQSASIPVLLRVGDPVGTPADQVQNVFTQAEAARSVPAIPFTSAVEGGGN